MEKPYWTDDGSSFEHVRRLKVALWGCERYKKQKLVWLRFRQLSSKISLWGRMRGNPLIHGNRGLSVCFPLQPKAIGPVSNNIVQLPVYPSLFGFLYGYISDFNWRYRLPASNAPYCILTSSKRCAWLTWARKATRSTIACKKRQANIVLRRMTEATGDCAPPLDSL